MTCYLRATFATVRQLEQFLKKTDFDIHLVCRKGQRVSPQSKVNLRKALKNSVQILVSPASQENLGLQVRHVTKFIESESQQIRLLKKYAHLGVVVLDFGICDNPEAVGQFDRFPSRFLSRVGKLGLDLEISYYKWSKMGRRP